MALAAAGTAERPVPHVPSAPRHHHLGSAYMQPSKPNGSRAAGKQEQVMGCKRGAGSARAAAIPHHFASLLALPPELRSRPEARAMCAGRQARVAGGLQGTVSQSRHWKRNGEGTFISLHGACCASVAAGG